MSARTRTIRRALLAAAPVAMGAAVLAPATVAQAHEDVWTKHDIAHTEGCPCYFRDSFDLTTFERDPGGEAWKEMIFNGDDVMVGKVEFHPHDELVYVYDTLANNDALYVQVTWGDKAAYIKVPSGQRYTVRDLNIPEGTTVQVKVWDDGWGKDQIASFPPVA